MWSGGVRIGLHTFQNNLVDVKHEFFHTERQKLGCNSYKESH